VGAHRRVRDEDVDVRIDAPSVSRRHARITIAAGEPPAIEDLGSKNGGVAPTNPAASSGRAPAEAGSSQ